MASVAVKSLDTMTHAQLCCTYASLILHDEGLDLSAAQMKKLITTSGNKVESFWPSIFAKALDGQNVKELLMGGGAVAGPITGGSSAAQPKAQAVAVKG